MDTDQLPEVKHLIVGAGEVGTALHTVLGRAHTVAIRDMPDVEVTAETLHVCIPWSGGFVETVHDYIGRHQAKLVVIHSTVPVGVCDRQGWIHSPVRGQHPHLVEGLTVFVKHFGGRRASEAAQAFDAAGIRVTTHESAADTEAGKLWELIQYGVNIVVEKAVHEWCGKHGLDFDVVYTAMAATYNDGWARLEHPEFVRPVLKHVPGPIGGHCVTTNARLVDHPLADMVRQPFGDW